jgi:hypothetical protein
VNRREFIRNTSLAASSLGLAPTVTWAADTNQPSHDTPIDRHALVSRHNVILNVYDRDNPLQVGNGSFAFAMDATGLQSFADDLGTYSDWAWHTFPNPENFREEETLREVVSGGRHKAKYACGQIPDPDWTPQQQARAKAAYEWYRRAPHRLHLGRIGFELLKADGTSAGPADLQDLQQTLDLWLGTVTSSFKLEGVPVEVTTCCHPKLDLVAVRAQSPLMASGRLNVFWRFPYVESDKCNPTWSADTDAKHRTEAALHGTRADLTRTLDADRHHVSIAWNSGQWSSTGPHQFVLMPARTVEEFNFVAGFGGQPLGRLPDFTETANTAAEHWPEFWNSGGAIDLSASKDPRWHELERRIVLSQYLTAVNSTGSSPPQESGLFSNSWYGKFHLEMTLWHGAHFMSWGRAPLLAGWMKWFRGPGLESARRQAAKQGYRGTRWMKMVSPEPKWESPSNQNPFRMTQQGHAIYWAELMYRETPTPATLEQFKHIVMESAEFMADFVWWDDKTGRYILGPPLLTGSESTPWNETYNSTVELSYWFYGLRTAQLWRERMGLPREPKWDAILAKLSKPPVVNGLCVDSEPFPAYQKNTHSRPAWLEAYGCMRGDEIDTQAMQHSFDAIWADFKNGVPWQIWGNDFTMLAMTAARLGRPQDAVDALLLDHPRNVCLANGFNNSGSRPYLPATGGLLWAVAMMAAGWDGGPTGHAPGFPADGSWTVKWEGLKKAA